MNASSNTIDFEHQFERFSNESIKLKFDSTKENFEDYYRKFNIIVKINNYSLSKTIKEFLLSLDNQSFTYLLQNPNFEKLVDEEKLNDLVEYLSFRFSKKNILTYQLELNNMNQCFEESVETYATRLLNLLKKAYPNNNVEMGNLMGKQIFLKGIKDVFIRNKLLKVIENNDLDEIIKIAVKLEMFQEQSNLLTQNFNNINLNSEINFVTSKFNNMVDNINYNQYNQDRFRRNDSQFNS